MPIVEIFDELAGRTTPLQGLLQSLEGFKQPARQQAAYKASEPQAQATLLASLPDVVTSISLSLYSYQYTHT